MVVADFLSILAALKGYANCLNSKGHAKQFQSLESLVEQTKKETKLNKTFLFPSWPNIFLASLPFGGVFNWSQHRSLLLRIKLLLQEQRTFT